MMQWNQILSLNEVIDLFHGHSPQAKIREIKLEYEGPIPRYRIKGIDGKERVTLYVNARTGAILKDRSKTVRERRAKKMQQKTIDVKGLMPLEEIDAIALDHAPVDITYEWELEQKKRRAVWEVMLSDDSGEKVYEVKVDAHDGTVVEIKLDKL